MVVVPAPLAANWGKEATMWLDGRLTQVLVLSQDRRTAAFQSWWKEMDEKGVPKRQRLIVATLQASKLLQ